MQRTKTTPLKAYLLRNNLSIYAFSRLTGIGEATLSDLAKGLRRACKRTALRICEISEGELTLEDFGYTKCDTIIKQDGESSAVRKYMRGAAGKPISRDGFNGKKKMD
jgi:hypothetical protein